MTSFEDYVFVVFLIFLAWAPFWFGSNRPFAWGVNAVAVGVLTLIFEMGLVVTGRPHPVSFKYLWFPALAAVLVGLWCVLQVAPFIPVAYQNPIWQMARDALGEEVQGSISVNRDETVTALMRFTTYALTFWLAAQLCRAPERGRRLVRGLAVVGGLYAIYGIVAFYAFPKTILWFDKQYYLDNVTATFVNRNSYATYAGIGLVCALAAALEAYLRAAEGRRTVRQIAAGLIAATVTNGLWLSAIFITTIALAQTASRGGILASIAGVLALILLAAVRGRKKAVAVGFGALAGGFVLCAALFNYGDLFAERLTMQGLESADRLKTYALTWRSISNSPFFGFGDGTFKHVFPIYRDSDIGPFGYWDLAHNTYLEALQGLGLPVASLLIMTLVYLIGRSIYGALTRSRSAVACLAASAASVIVALHAFVDFSLQMQAIALTWSALLGAGFAQSWSSQIRLGDGGRSAPAHRAAREADFQKPESSPAFGPRRVASL